MALASQATSPLGGAEGLRYRRSASVRDGLELRSEGRVGSPGAPPRAATDSQLRGRVPFVARAFTPASAPVAGSTLFGRPAAYQRDRPITASAPGVAILGAEDARATTAHELSLLVEASRADVPEVQLAAIRALGRLERRDVLNALLPLLGARDGSARAEAFLAVAQALQGSPLGSGTAQQLETVLSVLEQRTYAEAAPGIVATVAKALARLPYVNSRQVSRAEAALIDMLSLSPKLRLDLSNPRNGQVVMVAAAWGLETLGRRQRANFRPAESTIHWLRGLASGTRTIGSIDASRATRAPAFQALIGARLLDEDTLRSNLTASDEVLRRLAMLSLAGAGSPIASADRADYIRQGLTDRSYFVRYEAVRAYARHQAEADGCLPLAQMLSDASEHVALTVIDALGDACVDDKDIVTRLVAEARTPPEVGSWRRDSHALVALAKVSVPHLEIPLVTHSRHNRWQVRMYAARAAAISKDVESLERLAFDENDNVREATLAALKRLKGQEAERTFVAALARDDYQLLRTASREMADLPVTSDLANALANALTRITAQRRETSRDARIALLERLAQFGTKELTERVMPLRRDFDPRIAAAASAVLRQWTGDIHQPDPQPLPRQPLPAAVEIETATECTVELVMDSGRDLPIRLRPDVAPVTSVRFLRLANANYFDGLTFHRVVPNFVVQGGSPGANEYMGDGPFLRDEISELSHARGTIGLSTRGRDTGDAQFFINLVDNPRLDFDYTVFGAVAGSLENIDMIQEGDRITDVKVVCPTR